MPVSPSPQWHGPATSGHGRRRPATSTVLAAPHRRMLHGRPASGTHLRPAITQMLSSGRLPPASAPANLLMRAASPSLATPARTVSNSASGDTTAAKATPAAAATHGLRLLTGDCLWARYLSLPAKPTAVEPLEDLAAASTRTLSPATIPSRVSQPSGCSTQPADGRRPNFA